MRLLSSRACATGHRGSAWRLAHCKPRQDERALDHLIRQGFDCYWPPLRRERLLRGRRQTVGESLIPGYLFAHLHPNRSWSPLRSTHSVNRLASFGSYPLEIPQTFVDTLQQRTSSKQQLQSGDRIGIVEGGRIYGGMASFECFHRTKVRGGSVSARRNDSKRVLAAPLLDYCGTRVAKRANLTTICNLYVSVSNASLPAQKSNVSTYRKKTVVGAVLRYAFIDRFPLGERLVIE